jgi:hypothetical protein
MELFWKVNHEKEIDYILLNGDLIGHNIASDDPTGDDPVKYELLKKTHAIV